MPLSPLRLQRIPHALNASFALETYPFHFQCTPYASNMHPSVLRASDAFTLPHMHLPYVGCSQTHPPHTPRFERIPCTSNASPPLQCVLCTYETTLSPQTRPLHLKRTLSMPSILEGSSKILQTTHTHPIHPLYFTHAPTHPPHFRHLQRIPLASPPSDTSLTPLTPPPLLFRVPSSETVTRSPQARPDARSHGEPLSVLNLQYPV